jgi:hypothetical protein
MNIVYKARRNLARNGFSITNTEIQQEYKKYLKQRGVEQMRQMLLLVPPTTHNLLKNEIG